MNYLYLFFVFFTKLNRKLFNHLMCIKKVPLANKKSCWMQYSFKISRILRYMILLDQRLPGTLLYPSPSSFFGSWSLERRGWGEGECWRSAASFHKTIDSFISIIAKAELHSFLLSLFIRIVVSFNLYSYGYQNIKREKEIIIPPFLLFSLSLSFREVSL